MMPNCIVKYLFIKKIPLIITCSPFIILLSYRLKKISLLYYNALDKPFFPKKISVIKILNFKFYNHKSLWQKFIFS